MTDLDTVLSERSSEGLEPNLAPVGNGWTFSVTDVSDTDGYSRAVEGVSITALRAGETVAPTLVRAAIGDHFGTSSARIGFPMLGHATVESDRMVVVSIESVPSHGSRWCNIDLTPGAIIVYAPGAEHTAVNQPGLAFTFVSLELSTLEAMADRLGTRPFVPGPGEVHEIVGSPAAGALSATFAELRSVGEGHPGPLHLLEADVVASVSRFLGQEHVSNRIGASRRIDSRIVVRACVDYAKALERIPSIAELCAVAHVSERRLRQAFTDEFDCPPTRFFRLWALQRAHDRLRYSSTRETTVTDVAARLGFFHMGRFSEHYRRVFGELPSATLKTFAQRRA